MLGQIKQTFNDIKDAIRKRGVTVDECDSPTTYASKILSIGNSGASVLFIPVFKASATKPLKPTSAMSSSTPTNYPEGWGIPDGLDGTIWMSYTIVGDNYTIVPWTDPIAINKPEDSTSRSFTIYLNAYSTTDSIPKPTGITWNTTTNKLEGISNQLNPLEWCDSYYYVAGMYTYISYGSFDSKGNLIGEWSDPFCINMSSKGADGKNGVSSFTSIVFTRSESRPATPEGGTYVNPIPDGWHDGIPAGSHTVWMSSRVFSSNGEAPQSDSWTDPQTISDTEYMDYEFSASEDPGEPKKANPAVSEENPLWSNVASENTIYMAMRPIKNGAYDGQWQIIKIKGEKGEDGADGKPGEDGKSAQYIFKRFTSEAEYNTYKNHEDLTAFPLPPYEEWGDDISDEAKSWSDDPEGIGYETLENGEQRFWAIEACKRSSYDDAEGKWRDWTPAVIWCKWGEDGIDGSSVEYIYCLRDKAKKEDGKTLWLTSQKYPLPKDISSSSNEVSDKSKDGFIPAGWVNDPVAVSDTYPYLFCSVRKKINGEWGDFSEPVIWSNLMSRSAVIELINDKPEGSEVKIRGDMVDINTSKLTIYNENGDLVQVDINGAINAAVGKFDNLTTNKLETIQNIVNEDPVTYDKPRIGIDEGKLSVYDTSGSLRIEIGMGSYIEEDGTLKTTGELRPVINFYEADGKTVAYQLDAAGLIHVNQTVTELEVWDAASKLVEGTTKLYAISPDQIIYTKFNREIADPSAYEYDNPDYALQSDVYPIGEDTSYYIYNGSWGHKTADGSKISGSDIYLTGLEDYASVYSTNPNNNTIKFKNDTSSNYYLLLNRALGLIKAQDTSGSDRKWGTGSDNEKSIFCLPSYSKLSTYALSSGYYIYTGLLRDIATNGVQESHLVYNSKDKIIQVGHKIMNDLPVYYPLRKVAYRYYTGSNPTNNKPAYCLDMNDIAAGSSGGYLYYIVVPGYDDKVDTPAIIKCELVNGRWYTMYDYNNYINISDSARYEFTSDVNKSS